MKGDVFECVQNSFYSCRKFCENYPGYVLSDPGSREALIIHVAFVFRASSTSIEDPTRLQIQIE